MANVTGGEIKWTLDVEDSAFNQKLSRARTSVSDLAGDVKTSEKSLSSSFKSLSTNTTSSLNQALGSINNTGVGLTGLSTSLQSISKSSGASLDTLTGVFDNVNKSGKLFAGDTLTLLNNNVPITTALSQQLGVSISQVEKSIAAGTVTASQFNKALLSLAPVGQQNVSVFRSFFSTLGSIDFKGASSAFGSIAGSIENLGKKVALLVAGSGGIGTVFLKSAADLQQTSKSFEVLTGNAQVANKLFAQLAEFAASTPFEFPELAKAGRTLLGFGISSDQVFGKVKILGDIAAATGADFNSLAVVFGQVNATGKLMGQDALQLINNNIPITTILAKKLGVSVQEVKSRMEDGAISAQLFNTALQETTQKGGFAFQGTEILAQSLNGRLSTLKDTVLEFGRNLIGVKVDPKLGLVIEPGGIFDRFSQLIPRVTSGLADLAPTVKGAFDFLLRNGNTVIAILAGIGAAFLTAKTAAIAFALAARIAAQAQLLAAGATPWGLIAVAITGVVAALAFLQVRFDIFGKAARSLAPIFSTIVTVARLLFDTFTGGDPTLRATEKRFQGLQKILTPVSTVIQAFLKLVGGSFRSIFQSLSSIVQQTTASLKPLFEIFADFASKHSKILLTGLKAIGIVLAAIAFAPIAAAALVFVGALKVLAVVLDFVADHFSIFKGIVIAIGVVVFGPIIAAVKLVIFAIKEVPIALRTLQKAFVDTFNGITKKVSFVFNEVSRLWNSTLKPIIKEIVDDLLFLNSIWVKVWAFMALIVVGSVSIIVGALIDGFTFAFNFIVNNVLIPIRDAFITIFTAVYSFVAPIVAAIANAIFTGFQLAYEYIVGPILRASVVFFNIFKSILEFTNTVAINIFNTLRDAFIGIYNFIAGIVGTIYTAVSTAFTNLFNAVSAPLGRIYNSVVDNFQRVFNFLSGVGSRLVDGIGDLSKTLYNSGRQLITGLIEGAGSLIGKVAEFMVSKLPSALQGPFKKALGINSPSKVFAGYGKNIVEGLIVGMDSSSGQLKNSIGNLSLDTSIPDINATVAPDVNGTSSAVGGRGGTVINQTNNVYNQVDLTQGLRDLAWQLAN